jgi:septum formation protein
MPDPSPIWYGFDLPLVLASRSPRRREILALAGIPFVVEPADVDEENDRDGDPAGLVARHSAMKADAVAGGHPLQPVLGADTLVWLDGEVLGKPVDRAEAVSMLGRLSGREHTVFGGICLVLGSRGFRSVAVETTRVRFRRLTALEIDAYVDTGEPMDKAGAYGIQGYGCAMVEGVCGCYFNVMGLPVARLVAMLEEAGAGR